MTTATALTISKYDAELSIEKVTLDKASVNLYSVAADSKTKEDAFDEYEIVLSEKPKTNVFTLPFTSKDLVFYYQPPLTQELDPKEYDSITETEAIKDGKIAVYRPENIVGSYAVYHASKSGGVYGTGKAFHIYRPWAQDAKGVRVWCSLKVEKDALVVTVPQSFLDKTVYPVIVDPTFGYTSIGATSLSISQGIAGYRATAPASGTVSSISGYIYGNTGNVNVTFALYNSGGAGNPTTKIDETEQITVGTTAQWNTANFVSPPSIVSGTEYFICWLFPVGSTFHYDSGGAAGIGFFIDAPIASFPDEVTGETSSTAQRSIYATYTAASTGQQLFCLLNCMGY